MSLLGSVVQWGGTLVGAVTGQPEIVGAATAAGTAINQAQSGGGTTGPYVYGDPPAGWPYTGDWKVAAAPGQMSDIDISSLLLKLDTTDRSALMSAYLKPRPKAAPYWNSVVVQNPRLIGIAAAGGDDYNRGQDEASLWNLMAQLFQKYRIAVYPQVPAGSSSAQPTIVQRIGTALTQAGQAAQDAAVSSLTNSAVEAGMPAVQRNVARQASDNSLWIILGIAGGILLAKVAFK